MRKTTGAALVLAIGIVALLLAIGFTFYFVTRGELYTAELALQQAKSEQLLRGALNIGISVLNEDIERHPEVTSLDHKWRALFSGAWVAGKSWGIRYTDAGGNFALKGSMQWKNAVPHVDIARPWIHFENLRGYLGSLPPERQILYVKFSDGYYEQLYNGPRSKEWLFYPRIEYLGSPVIYDYNAVLMIPSANFLSLEEIPQKVGNTYLYYRLDVNAKDINEIKRDGDIPKSQVPFLLPEFYGRVQYPNGSPVFSGTDRFGRRYDVEDFYTPEWVNAWADADLNGDGLKDAVWMPVGTDRFFSGVIFDISGDIKDDRNDGLDNNLNGLIDEAPDNQVNEEMGPFFAQGEILPVEDPADKYNTGLPDPEELFELGIFVYWGGADGLDNNCDGNVDDASEQKVYLTAPLPGVRFRVDWNVDGVINEYDKVPDENGNLVYLEVIFPPTFSVRRWTPSGFINYELTLNDVDCLDNDYDLLVNNYEAYAYVGPNNVENFFSITEPEAQGTVQLSLSGPPFVLKGFYQVGPGIAIPAYDRTKLNQDKPDVFNYRYAKFAMPGNWDSKDEYRFRSARNSAFHEINHFLDKDGNPFITGLLVYPERGRYFDGVAGNFRNVNYRDILPYIHITHTGEPVCELTGRVAIYIADESGRVNLNYVGGHYPLDFDFSNPYVGLPNKLLRTYFIPGISSQWLAGYGMETRFLPDIGIVRARKLWNLLTGTPAGQIDSSNQDYVLSITDLASYYDVAFPGYGGVDDNANAFLLLTNGLDDDGDGVIDNGVNQLLGVLEGIDEPGELRQNRPYLNKLAERDGKDNDGDGVIDEVGELGDRIISTVDQINELRDFGTPGTKEFDKVSPTLTTFGLAKEAQIKKFGAVLRGVNPVDVNYATSVQIAGILLLSEKPKSSLDTVNWRLPEGLDAYYFAQGLRSYEYEWRSWYKKSDDEPGFLYFGEDGFGNSLSALSGEETVFPVDPILKIMQLAVNIEDARDINVAQSRLTTEKVPGTLTSAEREVYLPSQNENSLNPFEKGHNPTNIRLRELEKYSKETLGETNVSWTIHDEWWANRVSNAGAKDLRTISYTVSGVESIRITELMVRPVRRLETEIPVYQNLYNYYLNEYPPGIPLFLCNTTLFSEFYLDPTPRWNLANSNLNVLGIENGFATNRTYLINPNSGNEDPDAPNVIEFRIRATSFLPSGRYYLVLNVSNLLGEPTLSREGGSRLKYSIKYCPVLVNDPGNYLDDTFLEPSIVEDLENDPSLVNNDSVFQRIQNDWIGINARGEATGAVFLPGQLENPNLTPPPYYWLDGVLPEEQPIDPNNKTFAVLVPSYTPNDGRSDNDYVLCIAFWPEVIEQNQTVVLNYLDFSQEPDHEYIEITNISDKPINLSGYTLEIGIPRDSGGKRTDPYKV
ncbi:MAG: hypothetical protein N3G21_02975, partial [Candidatus Hydrogenedentes bacterium]|nr:hypothetical protein [Candidatus Hydrogenedentota bacterium]